MENDATTQRLAAVPATEMNRAPSCTAKQVQRRQSDVGIRSIKATLLFYGDPLAQLVRYVSRLPCRRLPFDSLALLNHCNMMGISKRCLGPKRMLMVPGV